MSALDAKNFMLTDWRDGEQTFAVNRTGLDGGFVGQI